MKTDPLTVQRVHEIKDCGPNAIVSVMLDGRPSRTEDMVLKNCNISFAIGEGWVGECEVTDLELNRWTVDVRHIAAIRPAQQP